MINKVDRMKELIEVLNKASELYYQKNTFFSIYKMLFC